ncbi:Hydrolase-like protein [Theobroma cacao]|uniref:apyrase n=1 Tax=Theobroma cacao TaxID=3641 RepID=A0A061EHZ6_THECC|nr:Hydrolase-like protein [Theobroma cacao]
MVCQTWVHSSRLEIGGKQALVLLASLKILTCNGTALVSGAFSSFCATLEPQNIKSIEGGSTGTRIHVFGYRVEGKTENPVFDFKEGMESLRVNPGLSAYAEDPEGAADSLRELLEFGRRKVPRKLWGETEKLIEANPEELPVQGGWRKKQWNATAHQWDAAVRANGSQTAELSPQGWAGRQVKDVRVCPSEERLLVEGGNNRLLILANSAELMSESEYSLRRVHVNHQGYEG